MQGFDERFARHMKTVAVVIAAVTVIALNANFFNIYNAIVNDPKLRGIALAAGQSLVKQNAAEPAAAPAPSPAPAPAAGQPPAPAQPPAQSPAQPAAQAAVSGTSGTSGTSVADVRQAGQEVQQQVDAYEAFGFRRMHRSDWERYWSQEAPWSPTGYATWGPWLGEGLSVLFGWMITILLLSAGAPFWEDVLESLFGLKTLVRQKTATQNVEPASGGQVKT